MMSSIVILVRAFNKPKMNQLESYSARSEPITSMEEKDVKIEYCYWHSFCHSWKIIHILAKRMLCYKF